MKILKLSLVLLCLLSVSLITGSLQRTISFEQAADEGGMVSGVVAHEMSAAEAQLLASSNITWVSCDVTFNPSDISEWYQVYSLAQQYHLNVVGILDQHLMNYTTFTLSDWSNAVKQAVHAFGRFVKTWEIWNEPNYSWNALGYFDGTPQAYVTMLQTAYNDIKAIAPSDTVIGLGGMPLYTSNEPTYPDTYANQSLVWAQQVVQLGGMSFCDAIAVHAYPYGQYYPQIAGYFFEYYLQQYSRLCNKPIWLTEVGQESYSTNWTASNSAQSSFLSESYSLFQGLGVKAYLWYELNDNYTAIPDSNFGLFDNSGNQKPAFDTYVDVVNGLTPPTATSTPTSAASPTQNPATTPAPSTSPNATDTPTPFPAATPTSVPEENFVVDLIVALIVAFNVAASVYVKKHRLKKE
ncbi:MAG: glycosyl hydrolase [Candidatus Bathyarchaeia archaeon]